MTASIERSFTPTTDRERVYAACVDWQNAREYLAEVETDTECLLCAAAYRLCDDGPNVAGDIVAKILEQPAASWGNRLLAAFAITKNDGQWFVELAAEFTKADNKQPTGRASQ